jgi:hypothetical protein
MLLRKTDLWSAFMSLYLPAIQHAGLLQTTGGSVLFLPTCLGYFISESLKGRGYKFCDTKSNPTPAELCKESNEPRATGIVGGLNDYNG